MKNETPFFEVLDQLDEILLEANKEREIPSIFVSRRQFLLSEIEHMINNLADTSEIMKKINILLADDPLHLNEEDRPMLFDVWNALQRIRTVRSAGAVKDMVENASMRADAIAAIGKLAPLIQRLFPPEDKENDDAS